MSSDWPMPPLLPAPGGSAPRSHPLPRRSTPLSPTGVLRARQRMDPATQATSELSVLTEQLLDLPARLWRVNLEATKAQHLHDAMEAYTELAALAYQGMADGQLHDVAASALYRQRAVATSRRISRLQQDAAVSRPIPAPLADLAEAVGSRQRPSRRAALWRLRTRLYQDALIGWRNALAADTGGTSALPAYGRALEHLREAVGFAGIPTALLRIIRTLVFLALSIGGVITAVLVGAAASSLTLGQGRTATVLSAGAVFLLCAWGVALTWTTTGRTNLRTVLGATRWRLIEREGATALGLLSGWAWFAATLALLGVIGVTGYATSLFMGMLAPGGVLAGANDLASALTLGAGQPLALVMATAGTVLALPLVLALPSVLVYQGMHGREMARGSARLPLARRTAAQFALPLLACSTLLTLIAAFALVRQSPTLMQPLLTNGPLRLSWVAPLVAGAVLVPYLVALAIPFTLGMRRWRGARLSEATAQSQDLSAKLEHLAPTPELDADVTSVQYDVARLQYLQLHTAELRRERGTPFTVVEGIVAVIIVLAVAVLADSGLALALHAGIGQLP